MQHWAPERTLRPAHRPRLGAHQPRPGPAVPYLDVRARETCRGSWRGRGAPSGKRLPCACGPPRYGAAVPTAARTVRVHSAARLTHDRRMRRSQPASHWPRACILCGTSDAYQRGGCAPRRAPLSPMRARVSFLRRLVPGPQRCALASRSAARAPGLHRHRRKVPMTLGSGSAPLRCTCCCARQRLIGASEPGLRCCEATKSTPFDALITLWKRGFNHGERAIP